MVNYDKLFRIGCHKRLVWSMAIYRFEAKIISRAKRGRSVIAAAAYRAGTKLKDEIKDKVFDYLRKSKGVVATCILTSEGTPAWAMNSGELWNKVEAGEKRKDAQLAREFVLALQRELPAHVQFQVAKEWAEQELVSQGMVVELSLHNPRGGKNPHVHMFCTMRKFDDDKFCAKKATEWNDVAVLVAQRKSWADAVNDALEKAGLDVRVDHRSLKDRGIDAIPQPKIGVAATAMKRRGVLADPDRFKLVRKVKLFNEALMMLSAMEQADDDSLWGRSRAVLDRVQDKATELIKTGWQKLLDSQAAKPETKGPQFER
jgi:ATP-dependent exoDNAse (exonuclease V) alpha subunit